MSISKFESITQYNKNFDKIFLNVKQKGFACGYFSILTANRFLEYNAVDKKTHESNVEEAIKYTAKKKIYGGVDFNKLLETTSNLNKKEIIGTSIELINAGVLGYEHIFHNSDNVDKYAVIFLKNEKYFVVMYSKLQNKYYLRDCHESQQHNFYSINELTKRLDEAYQFKSNIDILDGEYIEYSSIEFIRIVEPFQQKIIENDISITDEMKKNTEEIPQNISERIKKIMEEEEKKNKITINFDDIVIETKKEIKEPIKQEIKEPIKQEIKEPIKQEIKEPIYLDNGFVYFE
jgi:hypothetical protein